MNLDDKQRIARELQLEAARRNLLDFTKYTFDGFMENWHHRVICAALDKVARWELSKVIIMAPPRQGKSEFVSRRFPAFMLGRNPGLLVMGCSHNQDLAREMSADVQAILRTQAYKDVFSTRLGRRESVDLWETATAQSLQGIEEPPRGKYKAASTGTGLAGFGWNLGLIDDYVGKAEDINSQRFLDKLWTWYVNDFTNRRALGAGAQVVMATPWHPDDLIGRILNGPDRDEWTVVRLPYMAEDAPPSYDPREPGEPLWPGFFLSVEQGVSTVEQAVEQARAFYAAKKEADPVGCAALFDCRPVAAGGLLMNASDFRTYEAPPSEVRKGCDAIYVSIDSTFKGKSNSDRVGVIVAARRGPDWYILDADAHIRNYPNTREYLRGLAGLYPEAIFIIEDKANGPALIDDLQGALPAVLPFNPGQSNKHSRAQMAAQAAKQGRIYWPKARYMPNVEVYKDEIVRFGEARYDDLMDALSQLIIAAKPKRGGPAALRRTNSLRGIF